MLGKIRPHRLTHTIYYGLILRYPANLIAPLMLMSPLLTVALGIVVTGDRFDLRTALGSGLALVGILLVTLEPKHVRPLVALLRGIRHG